MSVPINIGSDDFEGKAARASATTQNEALHTFKFLKYFFKKV
jgi:hypothetical protein